MSYTGTFYVKRIGGATYTTGMVGGGGYSVVVEKTEDGKTLYGVEADFFRSQNGAFGNSALPGTKGIDGFSFVAPSGQVKLVNNIEDAK